PGACGCVTPGAWLVKVDSLQVGIVPPDSLPRRGSTGNRLCVGASDAVSFAWSLPAADPGWAITGGQGTSCVTYTARTSGKALFKVALTAVSGCRDSSTFADSLAEGTVDVQASAPAQFALHGCTPNPFHTRATIGFDLAKPGWVELGVYSVDGREVASLVKHE